jgi:hypothetical protein
LIYHITEFCTFAVRLRRSAPKPAAAEVVEVVPCTSEDHWKVVASFYARELERAVDHANGLENRESEKIRLVGGGVVKEEREKLSPKEQFLAGLYGDS